MRNPVWNPDERRVRALVRLVGQLVLLLAVVLVFGFALVLVAVPLGLVTPQPPRPSGTALGLGVLALSVVVFTIATVASVALAGWWLDRRRLRDFGLRLDRWWWRDLVAGAVLGAVLIGLVVAALTVAGSVEVTDTLVAPADTDPAAVVALVLVAVLGIGLSEELLMRGYQLTNVAEGLRGALGPRGGLLAAVLVTAVIFGVGHGLNPNSDVLSTTNLVVAGVFFGIAYAVTGRLALPIGVHVTWNLFLGPVFGFPVSGMELTSASVVATESVGPELVTGGSFGPEGGLLGLAAPLLGIAAVLGWVRLTHGAVRLATSITSPPRGRAAPDEAPPTARH